MNKQKVLLYIIAIATFLLCISIGIAIPIIFNLDGFWKIFIELFFLVAGTSFWKPIVEEKLPIKKRRHQDSSKKDRNIKNVVIDDDSKSVNSLDEKSAPFSSYPSIIAEELRDEEQEQRALNEKKLSNSEDRQNWLTQKLSLPMWGVLLGSITMVLLFSLLLLQWRPASRNSTPRKDSYVHKQVSPIAHSSYSQISEAELTRHRDNVAKVYAILMEEGKQDFGDNLDSFVSNMSKIIDRKRVYELMNEDYEMGTFEEFDAAFYPATEEHLLKEEDRRWLFNSFAKENIISGTYDTFCTLLCFDSDLRSFYNKGIGLGLELGSYEEFKKYIR